MQISRKKKVQFFHLTIRKIVPTIKKHHPPSYQKVAYTFQNDIKIKELYKKLLWKRKVYAQIKKKHWRNPTNSYKFLFKILLPNMSIIHINLLVILSTHVCASMFKNSHFIKKNDPATIFLSSRSMEKLVACCPYFSMKKITTTKKERNMKMVVEIVVTGLRKRKKGPLYISI